MTAPKIEQDEISQSIDFDEFGIDLRNASSLKQQIGQALIDKMVERVESGTGIVFDGSGRGRRKKLRSPYSDEYADSLEFQAAGKNASRVNMTLSGDMLGAIDVLSATGNRVVIGIDDPDEAAKAHGHQTGKNNTVPKMKRPFFGLNQTEINQVLAEFKSDLDQLRARGDEDRSLIENALLDALASLRASVTINGQG